MDLDLKLQVETEALRQRRPQMLATLWAKVDESGQLSIETPDGPRQYALKPLGELYGAGVGTGRVDPKDDRFMPLMLGIEDAIVRHYESNPSLTDGAVLLVLGQLAMSPESAPSDALGRRIQNALRLALSVNDYSRQEVRQGLRHVVRSVERHSRAEGRRGYLDFIRGFLGGRR